MAVTTKAIRAKRKKVLTKQLKAQNRNAKMVAKRIARLEKQLWKIEMDALRESGLLQGLTWRFSSYISHIESMGFISKETTKNNKAVETMLRFWWRKCEGTFFPLQRTEDTVVGLSMELEDSDTGFDERDPMVINIFVHIYNDKLTMAEERVLQDLVLTEFVQKWGIKNIVKADKREA